MSLVLDLLHKGDVPGFNAYRTQKPDIEIDLTDQEFVNLDLSQINLSGREVLLIRTRFVDCVLVKANFSGGTRMSQTVFSDVKLCEADFRGSNTEGCIMESNVCISGAKLPIMDLKRCSWGAASLSCIGVEMFNNKLLQSELTVLLWNIYSQMALTGYRFK